MGWVILAAGVGAYIFLSRVAIRAVPPCPKTPVESEPMPTSMIDDQYDSVPANTPQYLRGQTAYREGVPECRCPYAKHEGRTGWLTGWHNARLNDRFEHLFTKYGLRPM